MPSNYRIPDECRICHRKENANSENWIRNMDYQNRSSKFSRNEGHWDSVSLLTRLSRIWIQCRVELAISEYHSVIKFNDIYLKLKPFSQALHQKWEKVAFNILLERMRKISYLISVTVFRLSASKLFIVNKVTRWTSRYITFINFSSYC